VDFIILILHYLNASMRYHLNISIYYRINSDFLSYRFKRAIFKIVLRNFIRITSVDSLFSQAILQNPLRVEHSIRCLGDQQLRLAYACSEAVH